MSVSYVKQHCFVYRGSPPHFPMQVSALQLLSPLPLSPPLSLCPLLLSLSLLSRAS